MQTPESLKLNPINVVHPQAQAEYGPKKLIILENNGVSLEKSALTQNYVLGGHIDRDPLNTSFAPQHEHRAVSMAGAQMSEVTFIGHYPGLNGDAVADSQPTKLRNSRFILVGEQSRGYKFEVMAPIAQPITQYVPTAVGKGSNLAGSSFKQADLQGTDFSGCNLQGSNFTAANLSGCNFTGANLTRCNFNQANLSNANFTGARLALSELSAAVTSKATDFSHSYLVGARFHCLLGEKFAYLGQFKGSIFADGNNRIEVANTDFSRVSGLVDGQFVCYYKSDVTLPKGVECVSTNRFRETRETIARNSDTPTTAPTAWSDGYTN